jgi:Transposase DDE domain
MEGLLWRMVVELLRSVQQRFSRGIYSDRDVLEVSLWAILHDRPACWACFPENWPDTCRPRRLPHPSTLSRRLRHAGVQQLTHQVHQAAVARFSVEKVALLDGKPLLVSDVSKDWDATNGRGTRGMSRGYKLHVAVSLQGIIEAFEVQPLNVNERLPARRLCRSLPGQVRRVLADGGYDSGPLHQTLSASRLKLYTPILNGYASPRSHPRRRVLLRLSRTPLWPRLKSLRDRVERPLAWLGNVGFGLKGLPNWVRRLPRVTRWVSGKILLYHAYRLYKQTAS